MRKELVLAAIAVGTLAACAPVDVTPPAELESRFKRLNSAGVALPEGQQQAINQWQTRGTEADGSQWSCVSDSSSGLVWEVKTNNRAQEPRDSLHTYSWYSADPVTGAANGGSCSTGSCDTVGYSNYLNATGLCGADSSDPTKTWRLPSVAELKTLVICDTDPASCESTTTAFGPKAFFPNMEVGFYWSNDGKDLNDYTERGAYAVDFSTGKTVTGLRRNGHYLRLVMGP